jgi:hypothetical protein
MNPEQRRMALKWTLSELGRHVDETDHTTAHARVLFSGMRDLRWMHEQSHRTGIVAEHEHPEWAEAEPEPVAVRVGEGEWRTARTFVAVRLNAGYGGSGQRRAGYLVYDVSLEHHPMVGFIADDGSDPRTLSSAYPGAIVLCSVDCKPAYYKESVRIGRTMRERELVDGATVDAARPWRREALRNQIASEHIREAAEPSGNENEEI